MTDPVSVCLQDQGHQHTLPEAVHCALGVSGKQQPPHVGMPQARDGIEPMRVREARTFPNSPPFSYYSPRGSLCNIKTHLTCKTLYRALRKPSPELQKVRLPSICDRSSYTRNSPDLSTRKQGPPSVLVSLFLWSPVIFEREVFQHETLCLYILASGMIMWFSVRKNLCCYRGRGLWALFAFCGQWSV